MDVEWWDLPVAHRRGSRHNLLGVDVYFDFAWSDYFRDNRVHFKNGKCLAGMAVDECPEGKRPGLLLTARADAPQAPITTETHRLLVVCLPTYRKEIGDPAAAYYAHALGGSVAELQALERLASKPGVLQGLLDQHLDAAAVAAWAGTNAERMDRLREIVGDRPATDVQPSIDSVVAVLKALDTLPDEIVTVLEAILGGLRDHATRTRFLEALTEDRSGRYVTSEVLGARILDRVDDAEAAARGYRALLDNPGSSETDLQGYIEAHPWLIGLEYVAVRPRAEVLRGKLDFILERFDGSHDVLELKSPADPIIVAGDAIDGRPPPASDYSLSPTLAQALAQVHVYRGVLTDHPETVEEQYGLKGTRFPRLIIVVGQARALPKHRARVLREFNRSLHRVEIVPYDALVARTETILSNIRSEVLPERTRVGAA